MRIFVTGATGFIGSRVVDDLIANGHEVLGLSRSAEKSSALRGAGAEVLEGSMTDLALMERAVRETDGVIHLAFNHDFSRFKQNAEEDRALIAAMGAAMAGTEKRMIVTSGTLIAQAAPGQPAKESDPAAGSEHHVRAASEEAAMALVAEGVDVSIMRLPQVHDRVRQGFVSLAIDAWRKNGVCAWIGDGANRWPAGHVTDVARLYRLAFEKGERGAKYHAAAEEGVAVRDMAEAVGERLGLPTRSLGKEEAAEFFGWFAMFAGLDGPASSAWTRRELGWDPVGPGLIADLRELEVG